MTEISTEIAGIANSFYERGWMLGTSGNLSAVVSTVPLRLAITASGIDKGSIRPEQIVTIDQSGEPETVGVLKPSDERLIHLKLVTRRHAGAVLHTHSVWGTILSHKFRAAGSLTLEGYEMLKGIRGNQTHTCREVVPILENDQNMQAIANRLEGMFDRHPETHGFLLAGHGLYTWGQDLAEAKRHVEIFEFLLEVAGRGDFPT